VRHEADFLVIRKVACIQSINDNANACHIIILFVPCDQNRGSEMNQTKENLVRQERDFFFQESDTSPFSLLPAQ
jgi:hypothetical protein